METPCIEAPGYKQPNGYGRKSIDKRGNYAHRVAYVKANGLSMADIKGMVVRHKCDNRACINPDHLEIGTQADNVRDMVERGRAKGGYLKGTRNGRAKLNDEKVREIRKTFISGDADFGVEAMAAKYGVSPASIYFVVQGTTWKHVK
jgi:hypothetical protein